MYRVGPGLYTSISPIVAASVNISTISFPLHVTVMGSLVIDVLVHG